MLRTVSGGYGGSDRCLDGTMTYYRSPSVGEHTSACAPASEAVSNAGSWRAKTASLDFHAGHDNGIKAPRCKQKLRKCLLSFFGLISRCSWGWVSTFARMYGVSSWIPDVCHLLVGQLAQAARHVRQLALLLLVLLLLPVPEPPLRDPVLLPGPARISCNVFYHDIVKYLQNFKR